MKNRFSFLENFNPNFFLISALLAFGSITQAKYHKVPDEHVVIKIQSKAARLQLPNLLQLLIWNAQKGQNPNWSRDFLSLSRDRDLVLIEEAMYDINMMNTYQQAGPWEFTMAQSWYSDSAASTGVSTGSLSPSLSATWFRSPTTEPFAHTPKVSLVTTYQLESGSTLMVVNIHGINFTAPAELRMQLEKLNSTLDKHQGPLIVAGDFNTWNYFRSQALLEWMERHRLTEAHPDKDTRWLKLDHLFVRGCDIEKIEVLNNIDTSDHYPLQSTVECH